ncbi:CRISPR-associated helicase Cas3' [Desulfuromonas sp. AOP6]|uniref:CRISPR-associated helicase Cas3' n=1 Tax=Desulfuromonas sp. AOP6 TaxID=1566351 RepID=UPI001274CB4F|nr:CRISPR-associated helicase Cas3' [Desulfuromonas sp. AOP6]BCA79947.1 CRISPR-associated helicase Cas3 [Desulfuromonas sp. AOP6]
MIEFYARNGQTVANHLESVSKICGSLTEKIGEYETGELLGLLHDFGKYGGDFQSYIKSATGIFNPDIDKEYVDAKGLKGTIDHSTAGAQWIWRYCRNYGARGKLIGQILAVCLASHHGGLIDCLNPDGENVFLARMEKAEDKTNLNECILSADSQLLGRLTELASPGLLQACLKQVSALLSDSESKLVGWFMVGLWTRFLFSCLIDADRIDSADHEKPEYKSVRQSKPIEWQAAIARMEEKLADIPIKHDIDHLRRHISERCRERAGGDQGIYSLTVPTGGGKTFAGIRFALHHAHRHKLERIICIIPYTSIIEQNAEEIRKLIERGGDERPWVLEHHSNLEPEVQTWQSKLVSENWDAPIVFTTMVQFLETLFGGGTRGPRRMHQLAKTVLVFDEIQTLPINCVHLFCNSLNFLTEYAGTTALLCTATQPLLHQLKNSEKGQLTLPPENELVEDVGNLFEKLKRVDIRNRIKPGGWSEEELAELALNEYRGKGSCLVVVNTKDWARRLYTYCSRHLDSESIFHLSTGMCPAHRKEKLAVIKDRLKKKLPVLCLSTQLIEAGVDVDFASVIRFLAGLDSIAQAAGRCNRNGEAETAEVHVVNPAEEKIEQLVDIREGRDIAQRVLHEQADGNMLSPEAMSLYFSYYFYRRAEEMVYKVSAREAGRADSLLNLLSDNHNNVGVTQGLALRQSFKTAGKIFKAIDAPTEAVIVPYGKGEDLVANLCAESDQGKVRELLHEAQQYSVNVFPNVWRKLMAKGAVVPIHGGDFHYVNECYYSKEFGLSTEPVTGLKPQIC